MTYVDSAYQAADLFTKTLPADGLVKMKGMLGMKSLALLAMVQPGQAQMVGFEGQEAGWFPLVVIVLMFVRMGWSLMKFYAQNGANTLAFSRFRWPIETLIWLIAIGGVVVIEAIGVPLLMFQGG